MNVVTTESTALAQRLADRLARRMLSESLPLLGQVTTWLDLVEMCRELDRSLSITDQPSQAELELHRTILALAIGMGESLKSRLGREPADLSLVGADSATVNASLRMLEDSFTLWHNDLSRERREEILREVFGVAA